MTDRKIIKLKNIASFLSSLKNKKIVTINGSFDILHVGHIESLKKAKSKGDILIVLLNSDESINAYKGKNHPINTEKDRIRMLSAIQYVDYIIVFSDLTPGNLLGVIKPDIHCINKEWGKHCVERDNVIKSGGRIVVLDGVFGYSTTNLIKKIINMNSLSENYALLIDYNLIVDLNLKKSITSERNLKFISLDIPVSLGKILKKKNFKIIVMKDVAGNCIKNKCVKSDDDLYKLFHKHNFVLNKIYYKKSSAMGINFKIRCNDFLNIVNDLNLNLSKSWVVGGSEDLISFGRSYNIKTIKLGKNINNKIIQPNYYARNFKHAVDLIIRG